MADPAFPLPQTPTSWMSEDHQAAHRKYLDAGRSVFVLDDDELGHLRDATMYEQEVKAERKRRKALAEANREAARQQQSAAAVHQPAVTSLSKEAQEKLVDELNDAFLAGIDRGEFAPLAEFLEKQTPNVHGTLVSLALANLAVHCHGLRAERRKLAERVTALEARETAPPEPAAFPDKGIWNGLEHYVKNDCTTRDGSYWACRQDHAGQKPGTPAGAAFWRLAAKGGHGTVRAGHPGAIDAAELKL